jgi:hypothetical protein
MLRRLFVTASLALVASQAGCSTPPPMDCARQQVSEEGFVNGGFAGGFGGGFAGGRGGGGGAIPDLHTVGTPVTLRMFAPLTSCASDALRSSVEVLAPDNTAVESTFTAPQRAADAHVESTLTFTPARPGTYVVRASFEPSLGVRATTVQVLSSFVEQGVVVPAAPTPCAREPWPVTADTVACEWSAQRIALLHGDGGVDTFDGVNLVTAGEVLWSVNVDTLERRTWSADAGLVLTRAWPGFSTLRIRGLHTRDQAVRRRNVGTLVAAVTVDGGQVEATSNALDFALFFREPGDTVVRVLNDFVCSTGCLASVVALDTDFVWQQFGAGSPLNGFRRPFTEQTPFTRPSQLLTFTARHDTQQEELERLPLWVDLDSATAALVRPKNGGLEWSLWPKQRVLRVGPTHAVLRTDGGYLVAPLDR